MATKEAIANTSVSSKFRATCVKCFITFESRSRYENHYCYYPGTYVCTTCWNEFDNVMRLYDHIYQDTKECMGCLKRFREEILVMKPHIHFSPHMEKILPSKPIKHKCFAKTKSKKKNNVYKCLICEYVEMSKSFACSDCSAQFYTDAALKCHVFECHRSKYFCAECWLEVESEIHLRTHLSKYHEGPKHFTCPKCKKKIDTEENFKEHMTNFHGPKDYTCVECWKKFSSDKILKEHISDNHVNREYTCTECWKEMDSEVQLKWHISVRHSTKEKIQCTECWISVKSRYHLASHITTHISIQCPFCSRRFTALPKFVRHKKTHMKQKEHGCNECSYRTSFSSDLKRHKLTHSGVKPYKCKYCDFRSTQKKNLLSHEITKHGGVRPYECDICGYKSALKGTLQVHKLSHIKLPKTIECQHCNYTCARKSYLTRHMINIHTENKPNKDYKCDECSYRSARPADVKRHKLGHSEKSVKCELCNYATSAKRYLALHKQRIHGEMKDRNVLYCPSCDYTCKQKGHFTSHLLQHAKMEGKKYKQKKKNHT